MSLFFGLPYRIGDNYGGRGGRHFQSEAACVDRFDHLRVNLVKMLTNKLSTAYPISILHSPCECRSDRLWPLWKVLPSDEDHDRVVCARVCGTISTSIKLR